MNRNIGFILQVRLGSTRLPNKALANMHGVPLLEHLVRRVECSGLLEDMPLIVATTATSREIERYCAQRGLDCFIGEEEDVTGRVLDAARHFGLANLVRLQGDDPLVCPYGLREIVAAHRTGSAEFTTTAHASGWPVGMAAMAFRTDALEREYVRYGARNPDRLKKGFLPLDEVVFSSRFLRMADRAATGFFVTVDYPEDERLVTEILTRIDPARSGYGFTVEQVAETLAGMGDTSNHHLHEPFSSARGS